MSIRRGWTDRRTNFENSLSNEQLEKSIYVEKPRHVFSKMEQNEKVFKFERSI